MCNVLTSHMHAIHWNTKNSRGGSFKVEGVVTVRFPFRQTLSSARCPRRRTDRPGSLEIPYSMRYPSQSTYFLGQRKSRIVRFAILEM
jgi:hypothetical protein